MALPGSTFGGNLFDSAAMSNSTLPSIILTMAESFIPGLGLANSFTSTYFQIDPTHYIVILLGSIAACTGLAYIFSYAWDSIARFIVCSAEIRYDDEVFSYLMHWIAKQNFATHTQQFVASVKTTGSRRWAYDGEDDDETMQHEDADESSEAQTGDDWDKMKTVNYTPATGHHLFWYRGRPFYFQREKKENQGAWSSIVSETLYLKTLGRNTQLIKDLLQEAQMVYHSRDGGKTLIYRGMKPPGAAGDEMEWLKCLSRPPRPMSTVVLDETQKDNIISDMREYLHPFSQKWYSNRGLPYRRGYLFHGPPGTGKTSLCFALAGLLNLRIYVVSLNSKSVTEDSLAQLFADLPWRCIVLLEDIDSAGITNKRAAAKEVDEEDEVKVKKEEKDRNMDSEGSNSTNPRGITLSAFLNIIDGVASSEGRILVMTTNHIEKLDPAILRPGRVDVTIRFREADYEMTKSIFKAIYGNSDQPSTSKGEKASSKAENDYVHIKSHIETNSDSSKKSDQTVPAIKSPTRSVFRRHDRSEDEVEAMAEEFAGKIPVNVFTPAEIQGFLLRHKYSPEEAVGGAEEFVATLKAEKEVRKNGIA